MAVVVVGQLLGKIVGLPYSDPTDVENDATAALQGDVNVVAGVNGAGDQAGEYAFLTISPVAAATIASLVNGNCTITVSQGAGTLNVAVTQ